MLLESQINTFVDNLKKISGIETAIRGVFIPMEYQPDKFPIAFVSTANQRLKPGIASGDRYPDEEQDIAVYLTVFDKSNDYEDGYAELVELLPDVYKLIVKDFVISDAITIDRETAFMRIGDMANIANTPPYYSCRFDFTIKRKGKV